MPNGPLAVAAEGFPRRQPLRYPPRDRPFTLDRVLRPLSLAESVEMPPQNPIQDAGQQVLADVERASHRSTKDRFSSFPDSVVGHSSAEMGMKRFGIL